MFTHIPSRNKCLLVTLLVKSALEQFIQQYYFNLDVALRKTYRKTKNVIINLARSFKFKLSYVGHEAAEPKFKKAGVPQGIVLRPFYILFARVSFQHSVILFIVLLLTILP